MATYQDGHIWRKTLNAYPQRPNPHDWSGEKHEINGCMCRGAYNCPQNHFGHGGYFEIMQIGIIYGFGYIPFYLQWRKSFEYDVCSHFEFRCSNLGGLGLL